MDFRRRSDRTKGRVIITKRVRLGNLGLHAFQHVKGDFEKIDCMLPKWECKVRCGGTEMRHSRWNYPKPVRCIPAASLVFGMIALVACNTTDHREHNQNPSTHEVTVASNQPLPTPKKLLLEAANLTSQEVTALAQEGAPSWDSGLNQFRSVWRGHLDTSKNSDFGSLRHDLTVPARLTVVFPGVFALA